jgi:hypothetical protein
MNGKLISSLLAGLALVGTTAVLPVMAQDKMGDKMGDKMPAQGKMAGDKMGGKMQAPKPKPGAVLVTTGKFHKVSHQTTGTATIYENKDGNRDLYLTGFKTEAGPALHVYLVAAGDATDNPSVTKAGFIDLGALKKQNGNVVVSVPKGIDLWKYRAVTIWCAKFNVNFGTAPLTAKQ